MRYRFPYVGADLHKLADQPGISEHCETTDTSQYIMQYARFSPSFRRVLIPAYPQRVGSGWVGLGAWFCAEVVYPSKDGHQSRH